jgi:CDGSH-type Zn-finger protein
MSDVRIEITTDGPYKVSGPIELLDPEGNAIAVPTDRSVYLCRCGGSTNKPFCDGTHSAIGFEGAMAAVEQSDG